MGAPGSRVLRSTWKPGNRQVAERAWRRAAEDLAGSDLEATAESIRRRDKLDSTRVTSPLVAPPGALVLDSTGRSVESVVEEVLSQL